MPVQARQHFARMRGGAQAQLMLADDGHYYVVKFQNNPQHRRVLANELLAWTLLDYLGLPAAPGEIVEVSADLIGASAGLYFETAGRREPCRAGLQFGSRCPGDPSRLPVYDYLPDALLRQVGNVDAFVGMVAFDKWVSNANGRQAVFYRDRARRGFVTWMIDHGFAFRAQHWNFEDRPLTGIYPRTWLYEGVTGYNSFEPWLERITSISLEALDQAARRVPLEWWCEDDADALEKLVLELHRRRKKVAELVRSAKNANRDPFPNWR
jgi:hypothetical protein